jgi:hypothetical protein
MASNIIAGIAKADMQTGVAWLNVDLTANREQLIRCQSMLK